MAYLRDRPSRSRRQIAGRPQPNPYGRLCRGFDGGVGPTVCAYGMEHGWARRAVGGRARLGNSVPAHGTDRLVPLREGEYGPEEYGIIDSSRFDQPAFRDLSR